jgi:hypothetical protein
MRLTHHTDEPFELDRTRTYEQVSNFRMKPKGLWLSVDDDWWRWCSDESFREDTFEHNYEATLVEDANVLVIDSVESFDAFCEEYATEREPAWDLVATRYAGIIIAPYLWERRLAMEPTMFWYYPWDCASGCIWDLSVIDEWKETEKPAPREHANMES